MIENNFLIRFWLGLVETLILHRIVNGFRVPGDTSRREPREYFEIDRAKEAVNQIYFVRGTHRTPHCYITHPLIFKLVGY